MDTNSYILAIDQGTTSTRVIAYLLNQDKILKPVATAQKELPQIYPEKGWVEHCPETIIKDIIYLLQNTLSKLDKINNNYKILSIGITNQRETTVLWDSTNNKPVHNAIVWQDRRTAEYCVELRRLGLDNTIKQKTGLIIDPYFSASKINYLLEKYDLYNTPSKIKNIKFGTIDSFIIYNLTNGKSHTTDSSNASRTMLYNINNLSWDKELLDIFNIPDYILPEIININNNPSNKNNIYGIIDSSFAKNNKLEKLSNTPITAVAGDQQSASIGQLCFKPQNTKITYGTGCFAIQNTGKKIVNSKHKLISTILYVINDKPTYALEGSIFIAGAAVQWLRDALKIIKTAEETEHLASSLEHNHGVYLVPAFTGLGAPFWDPQARGAILGITRDTGFEHIARAALESVVYQTKDLLSAFEQDFHLPNIIKVDGGMTNNKWLLQFLSDITRINISKPADAETTVFGAALLSALGAGIYKSLDEILDIYNNKSDYSNYKSLLNTNISNNLYQGWSNAIARIKSK